MRVSIDKLTGKMIESQSGGETHSDPKIDDKVYAKSNLETLRQNAINAGHLEKNIEVKFATSEEYEALLEASKPVPTYSDLRKIAYGSINNQLDMQYWDLANGTTVWKDMIAQIKKDIPKE